jgi:hypothetical protein
MKRVFNGNYRTANRYDPQIIEGMGPVSPTSRNAPRDVTSLMPTVAGDADLLGEIFWPNIPTGTRVTPQMMIDQRNRFMTGLSGTGITHMPLMPCIEDSVVKAIYEGYLPESPQEAHVDKQETRYHSESLYKALLEQHTQFCDEVSKAEWNRLPEQCEFKKAMTTASNLMHTITDDAMSLLYKRAYPFQALIPTEANKGKAVNIDLIGPWDLDAGPGTEDQMFTESDPSPYNRTQYIKYLYSSYRVTMAAQLAGLAQVPARDMMAIRVDMAQDALRATRERMMLGVNYSPSDTTMSWRAAVGAGHIAYNGIYQIIQANTQTAGSGANWVTSSGNSYDQINKDLDDSYMYMAKYGMQPNIAFCDYATFGIYRRGLWEHFRTGPITEITSGISKIELAFPNAGGLAMIPHPFMPTATGSRCIMLLDSRMMARRVLWQDMNTQLAQINLSQKGVISAAETLIDKSDVSAALSLQGGVFAIA